MLKLKTSDGEHSEYIIFSTIESSIDIIVYKENSFSSFTATVSDESIKRWAQNVKISPEEYLSRLKEALLEHLKNSKQSNSNENIHESVPKASLGNDFDVSDGHLLWRQFFSDRGIYGRKGKFSLSQMTTEEGISRAFQIMFNEMCGYQNSLSKANSENSKYAQELSLAKDLAEQSVKLKAEFEKEIYGKFAAILNEKKKYISQLKKQITRKDDHNDITGNGDPLSTSMPSTSASCSTTTMKRGRSESSDEYDANTDVDEVDTDEEKEREVAALKRKQEHFNEFQKEPKKPWEQLDSSQDIFNDSMVSDLNVGLRKKK